MYTYLCGLKRMVTYAVYFHPTQQKCLMNVTYEYLYINISEAIMTFLTSFLTLF